MSKGYSRIESNSFDLCIDYTKTVIKLSQNWIEKHLKS